MAENNKINVAELLRNCPEGMELDSPVWSSVTLDHVKHRDHTTFPICIKTPNGKLDYLTAEGQFDCEVGSKCVIFPKGKNTWEGFVPPVEFKDGDVIYVETDKDDWVSIFKETYNHGIITYVDFSLNGVLNGEFFGIDSGASSLCAMCDIKEKRIATEEEKNKLFEEIKNRGYKWNLEKKCLEKLPKFKDGDFIYNSDIDAIAIFNEQTNDDIVSHCFLNKLGKLRISHHHSKNLSYWKFATEKEKIKLLRAINGNGYIWNAETKTLERIIKPKFKAGDFLKNTRRGLTGVVVSISDNGYYKISVEGGCTLVNITYQDDWELILDKFDINTLKPFESKVLVRYSSVGYWQPAFWGAYIHHDGYKGGKFLTTQGFAHYCIPYEGNEHLIGKQDDCSDFYKNW